MGINRISSLGSRVDTNRNLPRVSDLSNQVNYNSDLPLIAVNTIILNCGMHSRSIRAKLVSFKSKRVLCLNS